MPEYQENDAAPAITAQSRYDALQTERMPYLERARRAAKLTVPTLIPDDGANGTTNYPTPFTSVGSKGVNNLAAKLLLALFPPAAAFFRFDVEEALLDKLVGAAGENGAKVKEQIQQAMGKAERTVLKRIENTGQRVELFEALKHLLIAGNILVRMLKGGKLKLHPLSHYVVKRDPEGNLLELVVLECLAPESLPPEVRAIYDANHEANDGKGDKQYAELYTRVVREKRRFRVYQEICGIEIESTRGTYPLDACPWFPLRFIRVPSEDYGRGHCEEHEGDLRSCAKLSQALVEGAGIAAKTLFMVEEGGVTSKKKVAEAPNGAVVDGRAADVTVLRVEKIADFAFAKNTLDAIEKRLDESFLNGTAARRDAERVTAEEIRLIAGELEQALGGTYGTQTEELQRPLLACMIRDMQRAGDLPPFPEKIVTPKIITGLAALGRNADLQRLDAFIQGVSELFGPEAVAEAVNVSVYMNRRATALGVDVENLIRSEAEIAASREQKQRMELAQKLGPEAIRANTQRELAAGSQASGASPEQ